jgi:hypothetical protein
MSRSGYSDDYDCDGWQVIMWRGAVASAVRGRRGQAFLREMLTALDTMENKRLIAEELQHEGEVCAIGAVGARRGIDMSKLDPEDYESIADAFGISRALAQETMYMNDEWYRREDPEERYKRMRLWVLSLIKEKGPSV